jgi:hypothetical protein
MPMDQLTEMVLARIARAKCLLGLIEKELKQPSAMLGYEECSFTIELEAICTEMGSAAQERMDEIMASRTAKIVAHKLTYCAHGSADGHVQLMQQDGDGGRWLCPRCGVIADETEHGCQDDFADGIPEDDRDIPVALEFRDERTETTLGAIAETAK